jgi:hypothetical protein
MSRGSEPEGGRRNPFRRLGCAARRDYSAGPNMEQGAVNMCLFLWYEAIASWVFYE